MKPAPVDYEAPTQLAEAVALLSDPDVEAIVIAGGQSLVPMLNLRLARPDVLVDLRLIEGLDGITSEGDLLVIGAMATKRDAERSPLVKEHHPLLQASTLLVGHPQIRNRGTVGGSMAHADPAAEYPAVALASGAIFRVVGPSGERLIDAADFFQGYLTTALEPGEVLVEVCFPKMKPGTGWAFEEIARRNGDFAMVGAAIVLPVEGSGVIGDLRVVLFSVGPTPVRVLEVEELLRGERPDPALFKRAAELTREVIDEPGSDIHASAEFRRHLAGVMVERGLVNAAARAAGES